MSLSSELVIAEPEHLGFWNRLTAAVVSASIPFWLLNGVFAVFSGVDPNRTVYFPTQTPLQVIDAFAAPTAIVILGVLLVGYPVERFWVNATDTGITAAGKYGLLFSVLLVVAVVIGSLTGGAFGALLFAFIFITTGITATCGRLLYAKLVRAKLAMHVAAGAIASFLLMSLLHKATEAIG